MNSNPVYKFKVLLVSISVSRLYSNTGLDMVTGYLRSQGYFVNIIYYHQKETLEEVYNSLPYDYDLYGFCIFSSNYNMFRNITKHVKLKKPDCKIVWGGSFPTMYHDELFSSNDALDYIILGDGEKPLEYLIQNLSMGNSVINHKSIVARKNEKDKKVFYNQEIRHLPTWDYYKNVLPELNKYKTHCIQSKNNVCTGKCSFCYERKGPIFYKDIDQIVKEVEYVTRVFGVKRIYFTDDNLLDANGLIAKERTWQLCENLKKLKRKIVFTCYIKAISFKDTPFDHDLLQLMSDTGFATMFIGIESGNDKDLKLYNKLTTVADNYTIIKLLKAHKIVPLTGFINFNPYSTLETISDNFNYLTNIESVNLYSYACSFLNIYKNTEIFKLAKKDGLLKPSFNLLNDLDYIFIDDNVSAIVDFVRKYLTYPISSIKYQTSFLLQKCEEAIRLEPVNQKYREVLLNYQRKDLQVIKDFFRMLYVNNDIINAQKEVPAFLNHFYEESGRLRTIYKEISEVFE